MRRRFEDGYLTLQYLVAVGFSLVLFTALANLVVFQYGRGVVRAALDEGARAGARALGQDAAAIAACELRAASARDGLVSGRLADGIDLRCLAGPETIAARAVVRFDGWLPLIPDWRFEEVATALREVAP